MYYASWYADRPELLARIWYVLKTANYPVPDFLERYIKRITPETFIIALIELVNDVSISVEHDPMGSLFEPRE